MTNICSTVVLLLLTVKNCFQSVDIHAMNYGYTKSLKIGGILRGGSATEKNF